MGSPPDKDLTWWWFLSSEKTQDTLTVPPGLDPVTKDMLSPATYLLSARLGRRHQPASCPKEFWQMRRS